MDSCFAKARGWYGLGKHNVKHSKRESILVFAVQFRDVTGTSHALMLHVLLHPRCHALRTSSVISTNRTYVKVNNAPKTQPPRNKWAARTVFVLLLTPFTKLLCSLTQTVKARNTRTAGHLLGLLLRTSVIFGCNIIWNDPKRCGLAARDEKKWIGSSALLSDLPQNAQQTD